MKQNYEVVHGKATRCNISVAFFCVLIFWSIACSSILLCLLYVAFTIYLIIKMAAFDTETLHLPTSDLLHRTKGGAYKFGMDNLKPLDTLNLNGDIADNWKCWKQRWNFPANIYLFKVNNKNTRTMSVMLCYFLYC